MKTAIYLSDNSLSNLDCRNPQLGNPGIGGTEYEFLMLAYALAAFTDVEVNFYHYNNTNILPDGVKSWIIHDYFEAFQHAQAQGVEIMIFRGPCRPVEMLEAANKTKLKCIAWTHNFIDEDDLDALTKCDAIKRVVFVGHEHYDHYIYHPVIKKSTYIFNMFDGRHLKLRDFPIEPAVTYTGGLYHVKGFHILASMWKDILKEVPEAKLYVVGSGKLYNKFIELGPLGVAEKEYEDMFASSLMIDGKLMPSVNFLGTLGQEKTEVYYKTTVGVMNHSGASETFGISAIDMEACGVPVVTRAINGLFDTIKHGKTGLLGRNNDQIKNYIIKLLKDKELNLKLGRQAKEFAESEFLPEKLVKQWLKLFDDVMNDRPCEYIRPSENFGNNFKRLKIIDHWLMEHNIPLRFSKTKTFIKSKFPRVVSLIKKLLRRK